MKDESVVVWREKEARVLNLGAIWSASSNPTLPLPQNAHVLLRFPPLVITWPSLSPHRPPHPTHPFHSRCQNIQIPTTADNLRTSRVRAPLLPSTKLASCSLKSLLRTHVCRAVASSNRAFVDPGCKASPFLFLRLKCHTTTRAPPERAYDHDPTQKRLLGRHFPTRHNLRRLPSPIHSLHTKANSLSHSSRTKTG